MKGGLRINGEKHSRLFTTEVELKAGGVAFYDGAKEKRCGSRNAYVD